MLANEAEHQQQHATLSPVLVTHEIAQEIASLYPTDPDPALPLSHICTAQIAEFIPLTLKRLPRLSEPGPLGMRAEHW